MKTRYYKNMLIEEEISINKSDCKSINNHIKNYELTRNDIVFLINKISDLESQMPDMCPTCGAKL